MIGIDTVPPADGAQAAVTDPTAVSNAPAVDGAEDDGREGLTSVAESTDDLLRRLEEEKVEWQRQLDAMKKTLEDQDRKIEEDRSKRRTYIEKKNEEKKAAGIMMPANQAPSRTMVLGQYGGGVAGIPVINEWSRTIWPGMADFHNRRARGVARTMPSAFEAFSMPNNAQNRLGPSRYSNQGAGALAKYTGQRPMIAGYNAQDFKMDSMGRMVMTTKGERSMSSGGSTTLGIGGVVASAATPSTPTARSVGTSGVTFGAPQPNSGPAFGQVGALPTVTTSGQLMSGPVVTAADASSSWFGGTVSYVIDGASYLNPGSWFGGYSDASPVAGASMTPMSASPVAGASMTPMSQPAWQPGTPLTPMPQAAKPMAATPMAATPMAAYRPG